MSRSNLTFEDLVGMAARVGVKVVAAPSSHRGQLGTMGTVVGLVRHHTGTPNSYNASADYPDYNVVKEGRPDLDNSLSAFGLGRHEAIYVFSEFLSWHAGEWDYAGITDGNGHFLGIEAAGVGDWTDWQIDVYPRLCASILYDLGEGADMMPRHLDGCVPPGRKSDAANIWPSFLSEVENYLAHPELIPVGSTGKVVEEEMQFIAYRNAPQYGGNGATYLGAPGVWKPAYSLKLLSWYSHLGMLAKGQDGNGLWTDISPAQFAHLEQMYTAGMAVATPPGNIV